MATKIVGCKWNWCDNSFEGNEFEIHGCKGNRFCSKNCNILWNENDRWKKLNYKFQNGELKCYLCKKLMNPKHSHFVSNKKWLCSCECLTTYKPKRVKFVYID